MGPTVWNESTEIDTVEEISAEVVVHIGFIRDEAQDCDIYV